LPILNIYVNNLSMSWTIEYYSGKVQDDIYSLPESLQARYIHLSERMLVYGANLKEPHTKALEDGLFELRLKGKEGIARVLYCTVIGNRIVMLHSFIKKTDKIPRKELETAKHRMMEVRKNVNP
jgi:phage-related protein